MRTGECWWLCRTHPQGLDDQVTGLQLALHDAQQGEQLRLAQIIHVELAFLQNKEEENRLESQRSHLKHTSSCKVVKPRSR